ncbi:MAG: PQQ-binding-like beta-propeller repeat protein [Caldilineae bacterium]|nr:PQQ-binding-like beta-propeller repeat protein [Caldilineae bacterium]
MCLTRPAQRALALAALLVLTAALSGGTPSLDARILAAPAAPTGLSDGAGPSPRALVVDGEYDAIRVPGHVDLAPSAALTLETWVSREPALGCGTLVGSGRDSGYWLGICGGRLRFSPGGGAFTDGSAVLPERLWTHVAVTYDGRNRRYYVNGQLDRETSEQPLPLRFGPDELVIGADAELGAAFSGRIDTLRIWRVARSAAEIQRDMRRNLSATPGLVSEWAMDGDARDRVGMHDGAAVNGGTFTYDGVLPSALDLPLSESVVTIDGRCDPGEYGAAERMALDGNDRPNAFVQASAEELYVCIENLPRATNTNALAAIYIDRDASADSPAQPGDYRFSIRVRGNGEADEGDAKGGWRDLTLVPGEWQAASLVVDQLWRAEFRLPRRLIGARQDPDAEVEIGLALSYEEGRTIGEGIYWPSGARAGSPASWAPATLAEVPGIAPRIEFEGQVLRLDANGLEIGLADSSIQLLGAYEDALILLDAGVTDAAGHYALSHRARGRLPEAYLVRQANPRGSSSVAAEAGADASVMGPDLLSYPVDPNLPSPRTRYSAGRFIERIGAPPPEAGRQRYLIVYAPPVEVEDLWAMIESKRAQGFGVETISTDALMREGVGRDLAERIHNWLHAAWQADDEAPVYALLIGRGDKIPFRDVGWLDNDHRQPGSPGYFPAWPTDWYYADLDSDWDADGDGFYGELMGCRPGTSYPDRDAEDGKRDCPETGSLVREGPYGALRTAEDDFQAEIAVGRIALNEPGEVRRALAASVAAEASGYDARQRALVMGAFWSYAGSAWSEEAGSYVGGGAPQADPWVRSPWTGEKPFGHDAAEAMETQLLPILNPFMAAVTRLYETTVPAGLSFLSPSARQPDRPLNAAEVADAWSGDYGLVVAAGNGSPEALVAAHWQHDWNGNFAIDNPARPADCVGKTVAPGRVGPPCNELLTEALLSAQLPPPSGAAPLVLANAGRSAEVAWTWDGVNEGGNVIGLRYGPAALAGALPSRGLAAGWVGALGSIQPGSLDAFQARFAEALLADGMRAGDALWQANRDLALSQPYDLRAYGMAFFGDPAMSWSEGPPEVGGAWPTAGGDTRASGASPYSGPLAPETAWSSVEQLPQSPPALGRDGSLVLAGAGRVLRYDGGGNLAASVALGGAASSFAPALAEDAIYLAAGGDLVVLDEGLQTLDRIALPGGASATGSPRIASDGAIWVPGSSGMVRVSGGRALRMGAAGAVSGAAVFRHDGEAVWATTDGRVLGMRFERGRSSARQIADLGNVVLGAPALGRDDTVYVGASDGRLIAIPAEASRWQVGTGAAVSARPAIGPDGSVYVANARGTVAAYADGRGTPLWRLELGEAVRAPLSLDGSRLYVVAGSQLHAIDLATGLLSWSQALGGPTDARAEPIIGPDRSLYLLRSDQALVALREQGWLASPTEVTVETGLSATTLRWRDTSQGESGFRVELCVREGECREVGRAAAGARSLTLARQTLPAGTVFRARVQALGASGQDSGYGSSALAVVPDPAPSTPLSLSAEVLGSDRLALRWDYPGDTGQLEGFEIWRRESQGGIYRSLAFVGADARRFVDRDLAEGRDYDYRLTAVNGAGVSSSLEVQARTWPRNLQAPSDLVVRSRGLVVQLDWKDNARDERGYLVERRDPGSSSYRVVGRLSANVTRFYDALYLADGAYHYRVRAMGDAVDSTWLSIGTLVSTVERENLIFMPWATKRR